MPEFDFGQSDADADAEEVDFSTQEALGACPKCAGRVFEHGMAYVCEKAVGAGKTCDFRSGKVILQQEVARGDMQKLLTTGRTDLLKGFISNKTRRKFSAYLVRDAASGKVGFEFEPRAPKAGAKPGSKAAEAKPVKPAAAKAAPAVGVDKATALPGGRAKSALLAVADGDTAKKAVAKKPAARKPAAKKAAAKPAAKKPAAKKAG